ncbi:exonuclease domain-containing protein [Halarcobacter sp.]|uniref:3'-5' exonuclease n=1 Tax=Halarcobacter sp. TaxID=2321133 RepID=UPI003A9327A1
MINNLEGKKIISLDFEGNGQKEPDIVEIGISTIINLKKIGDHKSWLLKPENKITWQATKIHGIKNSDVENCKSFEDIKNEFYDEIKDSYVISHNSIVEINILSRKLPSFIPLGVIDTLKISRKILNNNIDSHSLDSLIKYFQLEPKINSYIKSHSHRAEYDAIATGLVFLELYKLDYTKLMSLVKTNKQTQLKLF